MAYFSRFWNVSSKEIIAVYDYGGTEIYYSTNNFITYNTKSVTNGTIAFVNTNGNGCLAIVSSTGYVDFTVDFGSNWTAYNNSGMYVDAPVAFSEDGKYIILPGNGGSSSLHKISTDYGQSWSNLPTSIYYGSGTYGGANCWINRAGTKALVACRSNGVGYSTDLDNNTWGLHTRNTGNFGDPSGLGRFVSAPSSDAWAYITQSWGNDVLYNRDGNVNSYTAPSTATGTSVAILVDDSGNIYYGYGTICELIASGGGTISTYFTATSSICGIWSDDDNTHIIIDTYGSDFYIDTTAGTGITKLANGNTMFSTKKGVLFAIDSSYNLQKSINWGSSWSNVTGSITLSSNAKISVRLC